MREGYILLYRKFLDNPLLNIKPFCKGYAWIQLISLANHTLGYIRVKNGTLVKVQRGECGYSEKALADLFGWSRNKLRRFLEQLKNEKMIQQKIVENHSIIKILKYNQYQTIQQKKQKKDNKRNNKRTQTINENKERDNKLSLSIEEREILKNYLIELNEKRKNKIEDLDAYIRKLIENGDCLTKLEKAKKKLERQQTKEVIPPAENEKEDIKKTEKARAKARAKVIQAMKGKKQNG